MLHNAERTSELSDRLERRALVAKHEPHDPIDKARLDLEVARQPARCGGLADARGPGDAGARSDHVLILCEQRVPHAWRQRVAVLAPRSQMAVVER